MAVLVPIFGGGGGPSTGGITVTIALTGQLNDLDDVVINNPQNGQLLRYNGFIWTNDAIYLPNVSDITSAKTSIVAISAQVQTISADLNSEINTRLNTDNFLQHQINELASGYRLVFSEQFVGDGVSTSFQLSGAITNAQIISGSWRTANVQNALPVNITDLDGKVIYDGGILSLFTRHRISVSGLNGSSLGTLDYPPQLGQSFKIWYWYELSTGDRVDNYYRDDFVAKMEETDGKLASAIAVDTTTFTTVLSASDINAQLAFNRLDKHIHAQYMTSETVASISANLQSQITSVCATNNIQTTQIQEISGNNISQAIQISQISGNAITLVQVSNASANAQLQTTNNLSPLIFAISSVNNSQASQIFSLSAAYNNAITLSQVSNASANALIQTTNNLSALIFETSGMVSVHSTQISELSARPIPDIFRLEIDAISASFVKKQGDTVYGAILFQNGSPELPQISFEQQPTTGIFIDVSSNNALSFTTNATKRLEITQDGGVQIGGVNGASPGPEVLQLGGVGYPIPELPNVRLKIIDEVDSYAQTNLQNLSNGESASSDYVATNDLGDDYAYWVDLGINGSNYTSVDWTVNGKNDAYVLAGPGVNLAVGTSDVTAHLTLFAGGTLTENEHVRIFPDGGMQIGGPYDNANSPGLGNIRLTSLSGSVVNSLLIHDNTGIIIDSEITVSDILALSQDSSAAVALVTELSGQIQAQSVQIAMLSGTNISQSIQIAELSASYTNNISLTQVANASANAQIQTTNNLSSLLYSISGSNISQSSQIAELSSNILNLTQVSNASANAQVQTTNNLSPLIFSISGSNISQANQIAALSAASNNVITLTQVNNASANAQVQTTNNLSSLLYAISGTNNSQANQIASLSGRPLPDIFKLEVSQISAGLNTRINSIVQESTIIVAGPGITASQNGNSWTLGITGGISQTNTGDASGISYTAELSAYWYNTSNPDNLQKATDNLAKTVYLTRHSNLRLASTGIMDGGELTRVSGILSGSAFNISGGNGYIVDQTLIEETDTLQTIPKIYYVSWNDKINISVTPYISSGYSAVYVLIDKNANHIILTEEPKSEDIRDNIYLGKVSHRFGSINTLNNYKRESIELYSQITDISQSIGSLNLRGNEYTAASTDLSLKKSAGESFRFSSNAQNNDKSPHVSTDPSINPVSFRSVYRANEEGTSLLYSSSGTVIQPNKWDNGSGVLQDISGGSNWTINRVYFFPVTNSTYIFYGQAVYSSLPDAKDGIGSENFKLNDSSFDSATFRAWIIVRDDATDLTDSNRAVFINAGKFGGSAGGGGGITTTQFQDSIFSIYDDAVPSNSIKFNLDSINSSGKTITVSAQRLTSDVDLVLPNKSGTLTIDSTVASLTGVLQTQLNSNQTTISSLTVITGNNISQAIQIAELSGNSISQASQIAALSASSGGSLTLVQVSNASANAQVQTTNHLSSLIFALSGISNLQANQISVISSGISIALSAHVEMIDPHSQYRLKSADIANSDLSDMTNSTIKGRFTAGTGSPEDLSVATVKTMLNIPSTISTISITGSGWKRIAKGETSSGRGIVEVVLETTGGSQAPQQVKILINRDWSTTFIEGFSGGILAFSPCGAFSYWTGVRLVMEVGSGATYLEANFVSPLSCNVTVRQPGAVLGGWVVANGEIESGTSTTIGNITFSNGCTIHSSKTLLGNNSVPNSSLADMSAARIKGRYAGIGEGDPLDLTVSQVKELLAYNIADISAEPFGVSNNLSPLIFSISGNNISQASQIASLSAALNDSLTIIHVSNASANAQIQTTNNLTPLIFSTSGNGISQAIQIAELSGRPISDISRIEVAAISAGLNTRINNITGGGSSTIIIAGPGITASQNGNTWTIGVTGSSVASSGAYSGPTPDIFRVEVAAVSSNLQYQIDNITIGGVNVNSAIVVMSGSQIVDRKDNKSFVYDVAGNLVGLTGSVGTKTFNYDINGNLISISGSGLYQTKSFQYDANGNLISVGVI